MRNAERSISERPVIERDVHGRRARLAAALLLEIAAPGAWRVCDGRVDQGNGRFLAFIEIKPDGFEVMQLAEDFVWSTFPTLQAALSHIVETHSAVGTPLATGMMARI